MRRILNLNTAIVLVFSLVSLNAIAQKLPSKQEGSLRAPSNVKIDGKASEWEFKSYSTSADVFYSVAHDNDNIYLVVKATDEAIVRKILSGGVTFVINNAAKKNDADAVKISYPHFNYRNKPYIKYPSEGVPADSIDSYVSASNKNFTNNSKFVSVYGVPGIDTLISVYNTNGINVASSFDKEMSYTYELAVSRKLIKNAVSTDGRLTYKIILNALGMDDLPGVTVTRSVSGEVTGVVFGNPPPGFKRNPSMMYATDVSGTYSLK